jgi:hypothetical protein
VLCDFLKGHNGIFKTSSCRFNFGERACSFCGGVNGLRKLNLHESYVELEMNLLWCGFECLSVLVWVKPAKK